MTEAFKAFPPGSHIDTCGFSSGAGLQMRSVSISVPARIHISPIDCNAFAIGQPGGGGIGFAIDIGNSATIAISESTSISTSFSTAEPVAQHFVAVAQAVFQSDRQYDCTLEFSSTMSQHFGLGSSVATACAVLQGINLLHGSPLSPNQLRLLIASNFVEEWNGLVTRGLETGVGTSVILQGGISVIAGALARLRLFAPSFHVTHCLADAVGAKVGTTSD